MEWIEIAKTRPPHGELIWVWDMESNYKFLIRYMGSEDTWFSQKENSRFPIWAPLNEKDDSMEWISVKDRLPKKVNTQYFVITPYGADVATYYSTGDGTGLVYWAKFDEGRFPLTVPVVYWMPLPQPPKGEQ